jgi:methylated-DNA-protein-cysteine methyltransferase related protein
MPRSPFYARLKRDVLTIVGAIPEGRVVTYADIGRHLDAMPRHVAYILATLDDHERRLVPWHRVIAADGTLGPARRGSAGEKQREALRGEGVTVAPDGRLTDAATKLMAVADLASGVPPQQRPADAPVRKRPVKRGSGLKG